jgi:hypothetical protein
VRLVRIDLSPLYHVLEQSRKDAPAFAVEVELQGFSVAHDGVGLAGASLAVGEDAAVVALG